MLECSQLSRNEWVILDVQASNEELFFQASNVPLCVEIQYYMANIGVRRNCPFKKALYLADKAKTLSLSSCNVESQ